MELLSFPTPIHLTEMDRDGISSVNNRLPLTNNQLNRATNHSTTYTGNQNVTKNITKQQQNLNSFYNKVVVYKQVLSY